MNPHAAIGGTRSSVSSEDGSHSLDHHCAHALVERLCLASRTSRRSNEDTLENLNWRRTILTILCYPQPDSRHMK